jgi:hypothetical protein
MKRIKKRFEKHSAFKWIIYFIWLFFLNPLFPKTTLLDFTSKFIREFLYSD